VIAEELASDIAATIHRCAAHLESAHWAEDAAMLIVCKPQIRDALAALESVQQLREAHKSVSWAVYSDTVVCSECSTAWPCPVIDLIDRTEIPA
jgi:hypothetical protein